MFAAKHVQSVSPLWRRKEELILSPAMALDEVAHERSSVSGGRLPVNGGSLRILIGPSNPLAVPNSGR